MASTFPKIPHLRKTPVSHQLIVHGEPFLLLAGELQNSSMTSAKFMKTVWQDMVDTNVNTLLGCVTWEMLEPEEGKFDFSELDQIIKDARSYGLHLVLLWFGSFKNGMSTYCPGWVKKDHKRFPRAHLRKAGGVLETTEVLSIFHTEGQKADAKAFAMLLRYLKEVDEEYSTVLMVQVENEIGLQGDSRDGSAAANKRFSEPVPADLISFLSKDFDNLLPDAKANLEVFKQGPKQGSWEAVFGKNQHTDELFMAYHYALYVKEVAAAGKKEYPIPLYTNVWQNMADLDQVAVDELPFEVPVVAGGGGEPGVYPSGGACAPVLDVWMEFCTSLDFIAPDVYLNDYVTSCKKYRHRNQPLFIPEQRRDENGVRRIWPAYASYQAMGTAPFGIDTLTPSTNPFTKHYGLLKSITPLVLEAQRTPNSSMGFYFDEFTPSGRDPTPPTTTRFGDWDVTIERCFVFGKPGTGAGMVIFTPPSTFLLIGWGFQALFKSVSSKSTFTGILRFVEKEVVGENGELKTLRVLNGDETRSGIFAMMPNEEPDYGGFPICVTIPAKTMIAECEVYSLEEDESDF
ncbi:MAG: hypothetical protein M1834_009497 [Cirrosporium novae-zelandiae]|nr:MAG: hypothetical protein M1834_009497 [Cirrosporium novae-zelandiae]